MRTRTDRPKRPLESRVSDNGSTPSSLHQAIGLIRALTGGSRRLLAADTRREAGLGSPGDDGAERLRAIALAVSGGLWRAEHGYRTTRSLPVTTRLFSSEGRVLPGRVCCAKRIRGIPAPLIRNVSEEERHQAIVNAAPPVTAARLVMRVRWRAFPPPQTVRKRGHFGMWRRAARASTCPRSAGLASRLTLFILAGFCAAAPRVTLLLLLHDFVLRPGDPPGPALPIGLCSHVNRIKARGKILLDRIRSTPYSSAPLPPSLAQLTMW